MQVNNNIQNNLNSSRMNFKARAEIQIAEGYKAFLNPIKKNDPEFACNLAQEVIDFVTLLKQVVPQIADDTHVVRLKPSSYLGKSDGALDLCYGEGENAREVTLFPHDNMQSGFVSFLEGLTNAGHKLLEKNKQGWSQFNMVDSNQFRRKRHPHGFLSGGVSETETVTFPQMLEKVSQLDTVG